MRNNNFGKEGNVSRNGIYFDSILDLWRKDDCRQREKKGLKMD